MLGERGIQTLLGSVRFTGEGGAGVGRASSPSPPLGLVPVP